MTDALREAAQAARTALSVAHGALLECSPCAADECRQTQQEWLDDARKEVEKAITDLRNALAAPQPEPIGVEAVAEVVETDDGPEIRWLVEGGIYALAPGCVLVM
jgi:hypothetical protein